MENDKYSVIRIRIIGFVSMVLLAWFFYSQIDQSNTFKKLGIFYILYFLFTIFVGIVSQELYDKGFRSKIFELFSELLLQIAFFSLLFLPVIYLNKFILSLIFRIFPNYLQSTSFVFFVVLVFLIINRYFVGYYNVLLFKLWHFDPFLLTKSNEVVNKSSVQQFIYFGIALLLIISQIDKGLYNVFSKEFNEIFIPATVTFIAIERALKSIKIE